MFKTGELINIEKFKENYKPVFTTLNENCRNMPDIQQLNFFVNMTLTAVFLDTMKILIL